MLRVARYDYVGWRRLLSFGVCDFLKRVARTCSEGPRLFLNSSGTSRRNRGLRCLASGLSGQTCDVLAALGPYGWRDAIGI